jgi:signal transduction histidine kinase
LEPGEFFGEVALIQEGPRNASVHTVTAATLLEIKREAFNQVLLSSAPVARRIILQVTHHLRDANTRNIEKLRAKNEELAAANAELQRQERLRSEFLTTISHELRTPLTAALGYLRFLNQGSCEFPPTQMMGFVGTIEKNLKTVVHLVNDILFLQEMELIKPDFEALDMAALVQEGVEVHREAAEDNGLTLVVEAAPDLPTIYGDSGSLSRALNALLDNAVKFSPEGGDIVVRVLPMERGALARSSTHTMGEVHIEIQDPGVGFPMDKLEELFKPFTRIESVDSHLFGGVGLGLPIAQHLVEVLHQGTLRAVSERGAGSTFTMILPVTDPPGEEAGTRIDAEG